MNYIVVLNWNSASETIECVKSLCKLNNFDDVKIVVCDNNSTNDSYENILNYFKKNHINNFFEMKEDEIYSKYEKSKFYIIKNLINYGYAGGNNLGIKFSLQQEDMDYVWILNNDTEVLPDTLDEMLNKFYSNINLGICGSKLVDWHNKKTVQSIGGVINPYLCTTKPLGSGFSVTDKLNETTNDLDIDFVVGASMLFSRVFLEKVGLFCEDYFLYYEEIDICNRAKDNNFDIGTSLNSIVFHKEGASTGKGKSDIADYCSVRNRILIARKFYSNKIVTVKIGLLIAIMNRICRFEFKRAIKYFKFIFI